MPGLAADRTPLIADVLDRFDSALCCRALDADPVAAAATSAEISPERVCNPMNVEGVCWRALNSATWRLSRADQTAHYQFAAVYHDGRYVYRFDAHRVTVGLFLAVLFGGYGGRCEAENALNIMVYDRDIDERMDQTAQRRQ